MTRLLAALSTVALAAAVGACSPTSVGRSSPGTVSAATPRATPAVIQRPTKVLLIVEENADVAGARKGMPVLARFGRQYGHTTHYRALAHPSLPNYLALAGGSTFGVRDDHSPSAHRIRGDSVFDQALAAHRSATAYEESMPSRCTLTSSGRYAVRHNPWTYFSGARSRSNCRRHDVPAGTRRFGSLHHDVVAGTLPTVGMLTPNLCHDAHSCSLAAANHWLAGWLRVIRRGPDWTSGRLAVVITFDEDDGARPDTVLTTVLSRSTHRVVSPVHYTHYSWTRYADYLIGVPPLRQARHAHSLRPAFEL